MKTTEEYLAKFKKEFKQIDAERAILSIITTPAILSKEINTHYHSVILELLPKITLVLRNKVNDWLAHCHHHQLNVNGTQKI